MSTTVLWAGNVANTQVVSIYNNPTGYEGNSAPVFDPNLYIDRMYFDTRYDYLQITSLTNLVLTYPYIEPYSTAIDSIKGKTPEEYPKQGYNEYVAYNHALGYPPVCLLVDSDTLEIIGSNMIVQNINNDSFRYLTLSVDNDNVYIKETFFVRRTPLTSLTRRYTLYIFSNSASTT